MEFQALKERKQIMYNICSRLFSLTFLTPHEKKNQKKKQKTAKQIKNNEKNDSQKEETMK